MANKAEKVAARPVILRQDKSNRDNGILISGTPPNAGEITGEFQGGISITLAIRTPERLRGPLDLVPSMVSEPDSSPEPQV
jgi:hypothetical protein